MGCCRSGGNRIKHQNYSLNAAKKYLMLTLRLFLSVKAVLFLKLQQSLSQMLATTANLLKKEILLSTAALTGAAQAVFLNTMDLFL